MSRLNNNLPSSVTRANEQLKSLDIPAAVSGAQAAITVQQASESRASSATSTVSPELRAFYNSNGTLPAPSSTGTNTTSDTTTSSSQMFYQMLQLMQMMMSQAFSNMSTNNSNTTSNSTSIDNSASTGSTASTSTNDTTDSTASSTPTSTDNTSQLDSLTSSLLDKTLNQVNGTGVDVNKTLDYVKKMTKMSQNLFQ